MYIYIYIDRYLAAIFSLCHRTVLSVVYSVVNVECMMDVSVNCIARSIQDGFPTVLQTR